MAINFDGVNEFYENSGSTSLGSSGSCSLFIYAQSSNWDHGGGHASVGGIFSPIAEWGADANGDFSLQRDRTTDVIRSVVRTATSTYTANASYPTTGEWHRIAIVYDESATELRLYIDSSTAAATTATAGARAAREASTALAGYPGNSSNTEFLGILAEACMWDRVLTTQELEGLLDTGFDPSTYTADALLYYPLYTAPGSSPFEIVNEGSATATLVKSSSTPDTATHPTFAAPESSGSFLLLGVG